MPVGGLRTVGSLRGEETALRLRYDVRSHDSPFGLRRNGPTELQTMSLHGALYACMILCMHVHARPQPASQLQLDADTPASHTQLYNCPT